MQPAEKTKSETLNQMGDESVIENLQYDQHQASSFGADKLDYGPNYTFASGAAKSPSSPRGSQFKRHQHHETTCQPQCQQACQPITSQPTVTLITIDAIAQTSAIILPRQPSQADATFFEILFGWDTFRTRVMLFFLIGFIMWLIIFFPLLSKKKL